MFTKKVFLVITLSAFLAGALLVFVTTNFGDMGLRVLLVLTLPIQVALLIKSIHFRGKVKKYGEYFERSNVIIRLKEDIDTPVGDFPAESSYIRYDSTNPPEEKQHRLFKPSTGSGVNSYVLSHNELLKLENDNSIIILGNIKS